MKKLAQFKQNARQLSCCTEFEPSDVKKCAEIGLYQRGGLQFDFT